MPRICVRVVFVWLSFDYFSDFARFTLLRFIRLLCGCEGFSLYRSIIGTFALIGCPYAGLARASQALCRAVAALVGHPLAISLLAACARVRACVRPLWRPEVGQVSVRAPGSIARRDARLLQ